MTCPEWLDELIRQLLAKKRASDRPFNARSVEGVLLQHLLDEFGEEGARKLTQAGVPPAVGVEREGRTWVIWVVLAAIVAGLALLAE